MSADALQYTNRSHWKRRETPPPQRDQAIVTADAFSMCETGIPVHSMAEANAAMAFPQ
jgi:hypothetical protein